MCVIRKWCTTNPYIYTKCSYISCLLIQCLLSRHNMNALPQTIRHMHAQRTQGPRSMSTGPAWLNSNFDLYMNRYSRYMSDLPTCRCDRLSLKRLRYRGNSVAHLVGHVSPVYHQTTMFISPYCRPTHMQLTTHDYRQ